jgi:hypothetical protein
VLDIDLDSLLDELQPEPQTQEKKTLPAAEMDLNSLLDELQGQGGATEPTPAPQPRRKKRGRKNPPKKRDLNAPEPDIEAAVLENILSLLGNV